MEAVKSLPPTFEKLIEELPGLINQESSVTKRSDATEAGDAIVAFGDNSIGEIEKLMGGVARATTCALKASA